MLITDKLTNKVYFSQRIKWYKCWDGIEKALKENGVEYHLLPNTKDVWVRDFMPVQTDTNSFAGYSYNPVYLKKYQHLRTSDVSKCFDFNDCEYRQTNLKIDGGNVIKCDDKIIMTNKVFRENRLFSKDYVIEQLKNTFGVSHIVIIPCDKEDNYGHADGMVRFVEEGHVLINNYRDYNSNLRRKLISALEPYFSNISELCYGKCSRVRSWAHLNFLRVGNLIFVPQVNIQSDLMAIEQISSVFEDCKVIAVNTNGIVRRGGALNCVSWNI